jgi:2-pyrone-4,6-dicarboxylate lactonase
MGFQSNPSKPKLKLPALACDAHVHVYGPFTKFPLAESRTFTPGEAPKEKLFALHEMLGIERCVIVQSGGHGFDNRVVADALAAKGGAYRGVALLPTDIDDAALKRMDAQGFCGVRYNFMTHLGEAAPIDAVIAVGARLAEFDWHLQIHCDSSLIGELTPALLRSPVPIVIDHMGRIDAAGWETQPAFSQLCRLLEDPRFWVKVSGCDRASRQGPPYRDAVPMARKLVADFGDKVVWGTDWPHPNHAFPDPDDGVLVDLLADIAPTAAALQALLVDNPQRLYRFTERLIS